MSTMLFLVLLLAALAGAVAATVLTVRGISSAFRRANATGRVGCGR